MTAYSLQLPFAAVNFSTGKTTDPLYAGYLAQQRVAQLYDQKPDSFERQNQPDFAGPKQSRLPQVRFEGVDFRVSFDTFFAAVAKGVEVMGQYIFPASLFAQPVLAKAVSREALQDAVKAAARVGRTLRYFA